MWCEGLHVGLIVAPRFEQAIQRGGELGVVRVIASVQAAQGKTGGQVGQLNVLGERAYPPCRRLLDEVFAGGRRTDRSMVVPRPVGAKRPGPRRAGQLCTDPGRPTTP